jgi:tRNA-splicing ligase RtcB
VSGFSFTSASPPTDIDTRGGVACRAWGAVHIQPEAIDQMRVAARLPITVATALMPDAHVGYGIPIGGVLATRDAVIPYAVGVDIACRVKLTVLDMKPHGLTRHADTLRKALERETRFGVGARFDRESRREHAVMDEDWTISPVTQSNRDRAWEQLGTSGSGNHFIEFGEFEVGPGGAEADGRRLEPGTYVALLSHSGSRGTGAAVCEHYSALARELHPDLPSDAAHLAWLPLDDERGQEYWRAMNLMGRYASANHACIHDSIVERLGAQAIFSVENHHNFAWREVHETPSGRHEVIVHRKGATPAGAGVLGFIPGSMATPGYLVRGRGDATSLASAAHGAGRKMSRSAAQKSLRWEDVQAALKRAHVTLLSAGLDEAPKVYKDIRAVMEAQADLVEAIAAFRPRIVKMAPAGEKPED